MGSRQLVVKNYFLYQLDVKKITALINISFHIGIKIFPANNLLHNCQMSMIIEILNFGYRNFHFWYIKEYHFNIIQLKLQFYQNTIVLDTYIS